MPDDPTRSSAPPSGMHGGLWSTFLGLLLLALVVLLWRSFVAQEERAVGASVDSEAERLASLVEGDIRYRFPALMRITRRWELLGSASREEFTQEAQSLMNDVPGFQAIEWVDRGYTVQWVVPLPGNEKAQGLYLGYEGRRRAAMERAKEAHVPVLSEPIDLVQGGKGLLAFFPIFVRGEFQGFVLAVFRVREWIESAWDVRTAPSAEYRFAAALERVPIYEQAGWDEVRDSPFASTAVARVLDRTLQIGVAPTRALLERRKTLIPSLTLAFGTLLSFLASAVFFLYQRVSLDSWKANAARAALEREVGERMRFERELRRTYARVDLATKAAGMGLWTWDLATNALHWNERMFELYGVPPDARPTYQTWRDALHPDDKSRAEELLRSAVEGRAVFDAEFRIMRRDGGVRHVRAAARVERDAEGSAKHVTGLNWDITDHRSTEEALSRSEAQVRLLLDSTGAAIYGIDLDGNCTFANPACARMLGYADPRLLLGKNMHRLIHHSYPGGRPMPASDCRIHVAHREGKGTHVEDEVLWRADGTSFAVEYWSCPQRVDGRVCGAVVAFHDITERRRAEAQRALAVQASDDTAATTAKRSPGA